MSHYIPHPLKGGHATRDVRLDRVPSATSEHLDKYPLTAATAPAKPTSMVAGVNWYTGLMEPTWMKAGGVWRWVIGQKDLGRLAGGHAVCLRNVNVTDLSGWHGYYDQGTEGRCVEFSMLRMLSQHNRKRYDLTTRWHYWEAQRVDEWPGGSYPGASPAYEGTSVRAGLEVLRSKGAIVANVLGRAYAPGRDPATLVKAAEGIAAYRWARNWSDVRTTLGVPSSLPGVPLVNSWGISWPHEVLLLDGAGERLLREDGEFGVIADR
jgi:hypothetical protein